MNPRVLTLLSLSAMFPGVAAAQTVEDRARAAAEASRARSSDSEAILENYINPGLGGQPVATVDKSKSFTPNLACQKTANFLEILIQPGAGGNISTVRIARDKDIDGQFDSVSTLPVPVSGICANGVISCRPGSWSDCRSFEWDVDSSGDLKLTEAPMPALAGCYCVNDSCGANLVMGNLPSVLKDLGGGAVGALSSHDPRIGVADARVNGPVIQYAGAQSTACSPDPALPQSAYRANPTAIHGDAFAASRSNSLFQSLAGSPAGAGRAEQVRACTIEREVSFQPLTYDDIVSASGSIYSVRDCGEDCRRYRVIGDGDCSGSPPIFTAHFEVSDAAKLVSARIVEMGADDWVQGRVNGRIVGSAGPRPWLTTGLPSGDCRTDGGAARNYTPYDFSADLRAGPATVSARVRGGGGGAPLTTEWGLVDVEIRVSPGCEPSERLVDLCAGTGGDPKCRLDSENVGHLRYRPTGPTYCNIYAYDFCTLAGVYLPRVWWTSRAIERLRAGEKVEPAYLATVDEMRANALYRWLSDYGADYGWRQTGTLSKLQDVANAGGIGIICARNTVEGRSGHIVMVVPETDTHRAGRDASGSVTAPLQSQAGRRNFKYGVSRPNWWLGDDFAASGFWVHD